MGSMERRVDLRARELARVAFEVLALVKERMAPHAILSGYTEVEDIEYAYRKVDFRDKSDVAELLGHAFKHVMVMETPDPERTNLYFFASDSRERLPLDQHNPSVIVRSGGGHVSGVRPRTSAASSAASATR